MLYAIWNLHLSSSRIGNGERSRKPPLRHGMKPPRRSKRKQSRRQRGLLINSTRSTLQRRRETSGKTSASPKSITSFSPLTPDPPPFPREHEEQFLAALSDSLSNGTTWQRICELVELQNSQSKTIARTGAGTTDLTRFKEVLLRLKREGDSAPGAAGY